MDKTIGADGKARGKPAPIKTTFLASTPDARMPAAKQRQGKRSDLNGTSRKLSEKSKRPVEARGQDRRQGGF